MENFSNDNRTTRKIMFRGGKKLCDYEIITEKCKDGVEREKILGEGSFGCVKLARNVETEKLYALKIVNSFWVLYIFDLLSFSFIYFIYINNIEVFFNMVEIY